LPVFVICPVAVAEVAVVAAEVAVVGTSYAAN
jgi:hypothetical protein